MNTHETVLIRVPEGMQWMVYHSTVLSDLTAVIRYHDQQSLKDCIESIGIPHTEIESCSVDSILVMSSHIMSPEEVITIEPRETLPYKGQRFILDAHLGKLATYLRLLGFNAVYFSDIDHPQILEGAEGSVILTRSRELLKHKLIAEGMLIRDTQVQEQVKEVMKRYQLIGSQRFLYRCSNCNGLLHEVSKESIAEDLEEETTLYIDSFFQCASCGKIYWYGSHYAKLENLLDDIR